MDSEVVKLNLHLLIHHRLLGLGVVVLASHPPHRHRPIRLLHPLILHILPVLQEARHHPPHLPPLRLGVPLLRHQEAPLVEVAVLNGKILF